MCVSGGETTVHAVDRIAGERVWSYSFERSLREIQTTADTVVCWTRSDDATGVHALSFGGDPIWSGISRGTTIPLTVTDSRTYLGTQTRYTVQLGG